MNYSYKPNSKGKLTVNLEQALILPIKDFATDNHGVITEITMAMPVWQKYDSNDHAIIKKAATTLLSKLTVEEVRKSDSKKEVKNVIASTCKIGAEILQSADPFQGMINVLGKACIGKSLSKYSCSQVAGLMGLVVTTFAPQVWSTVYLLKEIISPILVDDCTFSAKENYRWS